MKIDIDHIEWADRLQATVYGGQRASGRAKRLLPTLLDYCDTVTRHVTRALAASPTSDTKVDDPTPAPKLLPPPTQTALELPWIPTPPAALTYPEGKGSVLGEMIREKNKRIQDQAALIHSLMADQRRIEAKLKSYEEYTLPDGMVWDAADLISYLLLELGWSRLPPEKAALLQPKEMPAKPKSPNHKDVSGANTA